MRHILAGGSDLGGAAAAHQDGSTDEAESGSAGLRHGSEEATDFPARKDIGVDVHVGLAGIEGSDLRIQGRGDGATVVGDERRIVAAGEGHIKGLGVGATGDAGGEAEEGWGHGHDASGACASHGGRAVNVSGGDIPLQTAEGDFHLHGDQVQIQRHDGEAGAGGGIGRGLCRTGEVGVVHYGMRLGQRSQGKQSQAEEEFFHKMDGGLSYANGRTAASKYASETHLT